MAEIEGQIDVKLVKHDDGKSTLDVVFTGDVCFLYRACRAIVSEIEKTNEGEDNA
ncbi:MAG: hypothetical protein IJX20_03895 [Alphaproteobacteria bacterium]|nr:hypothetical protein [Alphaproteobacteria bacterium]